MCFSNTGHSGGSRLMGRRCVGAVMVRQVQVSFSDKNSKVTLTISSSPRCNCLALKVACKPRSLRETLFEFVFRARGTLTRRVPRDGVSVELTVGSPSPREGGTGDTSSGELTLAFTHSWNWDNEDSRWFQSSAVSGLGSVCV